MKQQNNELLQMYFSDIKQHKVLDGEVQKELIRKAQEGDEDAKDALITSNLRFVIMLVKQFRSTQLNINELISEGNMGLLTAIEKYDIKQDINFISYASWWIRHFIMRSIHQSGSLVRLPINKVRLITQIMQEQQYYMSMNDMPYELALITAGKNNNLSTSAVTELVNNSKFTFSLDQEIDQNNDSMITFLDTIEDEKTESIEVQIENDDIFEILELYVSKLPKREAEIVCKRFGLYGEEPQSLNTLSKEYGITKERVRQLERKGIQRLQKMRRQSENILQNNLKVA